MLVGQMELEQVYRTRVIVMMEPATFQSHLVGGGSNLRIFKGKYLLKNESHCV